MPVDTALVEAILTPIPGDNPSGKELRYDPRYDQVKEARREDLALPEGGLPGDRKLADWGVVFKLGRELLEKESKDLQLAAWLTEGLLKRDGFAGLATGARILGGIVDKFWDGCYPAWDEEDPEMRAGPLEWVGTKFDVPVKQLAIAPGMSYLELQASRAVPTEGEADSDKEKRHLRAALLGEGKTPPEVADKAVAEANKAFYKALVADADAALAAVGDLGKVCDARFGRDAPSFLKLHGAIDEFRRQASTILAQKLVDDPDPIVEEVVEEGGAAATADEGGPLTPEPVSPADAASRVAVAARFLRKVDPTNPGPYLMVRGLRWGELRAAAATGDFNPKLLEAAPTAVRARLKGMLLDGKWPELLEQCEAVMATPQGRGWLDLQRYAITACERQGPSFDAVAASIRDELRVLLAAIPQLPEMTLMDDTPTANAETQEWLEQQQVLPQEAAPEAEAAAEEAPPPAIDEAVVEEALVQEASSSKHGGLAAGPRRRPAPDPFELAKAEVRQGRAKKGYELLLAEVGREQSERGRFLRQVQLAFLMVEAGMDTVARPILERLVATVDEKSLEQWEAGPLVAQPMALLIRVLDRAGETESSERYQLYQRICKLDTLQAMALQTG
ncbi:MAG TPA: type VI secretion system protein TssA [Gemmatimonadaceae bacterium]|nr:type VI secretion system protein TssA [Gemmatimonadaceae bacterium]